LAGWVGPSSGTAVASSPTPLTVTELWHQLLGPGTGIFLSSPNVANLDGAGPSVVVGSRYSGGVYAFHISSGSPVSGWPRFLGAGIDSTPSVLPSGVGNLSNVYVSTGAVTPGALNPNSGGMFALGPSGNVLWDRPLADTFGAYGPNPAVSASPDLGDPGTGSPEAVVGTVGLSLYSVNPGNGGNNTGWPQPTADTTFSTTAAANIGGTQQIFAGSDSTAGPGALFNWDGGTLRRMNACGGTEWTVPTDEVVTSSPAVGNLDGSGPVVVFGHGRWWWDHRPGSVDADSVTAVDATTGARRWETHLGGYTIASPALADLLGNGQRDVVEPTWSALGQTTGGVVYALAPNGSPIWGPVTLPEPLGSQGDPNALIGSAATADFGEGYQDVVMASGFGWDILDGKTGIVVSNPGGEGLNINWDGNPANLSMQNSPLITPDPTTPGALDVVVAGTYGGVNGDDSQGFVAAYRVTGPGSGSTTGLSWPQFHHDPALTGSTIPPAAPPDPPPDCTGNYWLTGSDGGIFTYGDAGFYGSTGSLHLNQPVVGMAPTPDGRGYWLVAADGGIFTYGDASFYGSTGSLHLNQPVVGMASTPDGHGYWMVAADGGIFTYGDAGFYGSTGSLRLNRPVVGMAATPDGHGYWMVAADGGMFTFGDAAFEGSAATKPLNRPIVGMAATRDGFGYWLVASDGGIFTYGDAAFEGSMGGLALNAPVVGMAARH
jgi:hypothetical protein